MSDITNKLDVDLSETIEDESFINIDGQSFGVAQTTPPKDLLIKASKLHSIQEDLENSLARERALRGKNFRMLSALDLSSMTNEEIDRVLNESYETEEKIKHEVKKQNDIFSDIFSLGYELIKWSLGAEAFEKVKEQVEAMGSIELAGKAYEAVSKNKTLKKYMKNQDKVEK